MDLVEKSKIEKIEICCCTYKRPEKLRRLLQSLSEINYPQDIICEILIVDNDVSESARAIFAEFETCLNIKYVVEAEKGLSNARNKALTESILLGASHLAFIDDDEVADVNWLVNHVEFYNKFEEIYISSGPTYKKFDGDYPDYIVENEMFQASVTKELGKLRKTCASGNVFFPLNIIKENNVYFSKEFNVSGGEDSDFFGQLTSLGYKIGSNCTAVNHEIVGKDRCVISWILNRAYCNGRNYAYRKYKNKKKKFSRFYYIFRQTFFILLLTFIVLFSIFCGLTIFFNGLTELFVNFGKLLGAITLRLGVLYD